MDRASDRQPYDFAARLRAALANRGLSRKQLAAAVGVSQNTVTSWTQGRYRPDHENLSRIASALTMTLDDLHGGAVPADVPSGPARGSRTDLSDEDEARRIVGELAAFDLDATLQQLGRIAPDLMQLLAAARAYAERHSAADGPKTAD